MGNLIYKMPGEIPKDQAAEAASPDRDLKSTDFIRIKVERGSIILKIIARACVRM
jgi:hypothetical protein